MKILAAIALTFASLPAFAVQTVACPEKIHARVTGLQPDLTAHPNDPDLELLQEAFDALSRKRVIDAKASLEERASGRCEYRSAGSRMAIYSKEGHDLLMVEVSLTQRASVRIYARIAKMVPGAFKLESQARYGMMASFNSSPNGRYDGGPAVQSLGYAESFETEFRLEDELGNPTAAAALLNRPFRTCEAAALKAARTFARQNHARGSEFRVVETTDEFVYVQLVRPGSNGECWTNFKVWFTGGTCRVEDVRFDDDGEMCS